MLIQEETYINDFAILKVGFNMSTATKEAIENDIFSKHKADSLSVFSDTKNH